MAKDPSPVASMVGKALDIESAERSAELPAETHAIGNGSARGRVAAKAKGKVKADAKVKTPRRKHTFAIEDDLFEWLELVSIARKCDMSDLVNNGLWQYLPATVKIGGAMLTRSPRSEEKETAEASGQGSNGQGG